MPDLEDGEIEEGELPDTTVDTPQKTDEPEASAATAAATAAAPSVPSKPEPAEDPEPSVAPVLDMAATAMPPSDLGLLGLPIFDEPLRTYGSSMAYSAYGTLPYGAAPSAQLLDRRHTSLRDHASTSYGSPRFAHHHCGGPFASRYSEEYGYTPIYHHNRHTRDYDDSSSLDSLPKKGSHASSEDGSLDEGEVRPSSRLTRSLATRNRKPSDISALVSSIKASTSAANVPAAMKSLQAVSLDLLDALADLQELQRSLTDAARKSAKADDNAKLAESSAQFFKGLSTVHLVCNTGVGRTSNLSAAGKLVRAAIKQQDSLLTAAHRKELEGWIKSSRVFKALADGEEESLQPKKPKAEPQPRAPYIPRLGLMKQRKRAAEADADAPTANQTPGTAVSIKGGKQKIKLASQSKKQKNGRDESPPPLPLPDDSAAAADMDVDPVPPPPLPPPSPESTAVANGHHREQTGITTLLHSQKLSSLPASEDSESAAMPQVRPQVGFKLQGNRRQKLKKIVEEDDPSTIAMRAHLQRHLAMQQPHPQQPHPQQQQQQQSSVLQQASQIPLPEPSTAHRSIDVDQQAMNGAIPGLNNASTDAQNILNGHPHQQHQQQQQQKHKETARQAMTDEAHALPPGLEPLLQHLPRQLPEAEAELPPGLGPEPEQMPQQLPQQLSQQLSQQLPQQSQLHRHMHYRRNSRRSNRADASDVSPENELSALAEPQAVNGGSYANQALPQQSGYDRSSSEEAEQVMQQEPVSSSGYSHQYPIQQQQQRQQQRQQPGRHQIASASVKEVDQSLAQIAQRGGPVALPQTVPLPDPNGVPDDLASGHAAADDGNAANSHAADGLTSMQVLADDVKSLLRQRKLCLVLDLDHTLVNSARFTEVDPEHEAQLRSHLANESLRLPEAKRELFRLERIQMWTKLRPAVRHFLETAHQHFELWIHTNGNRSYAAAICELLDPSGRLFGHRVISQGAADGMQQDLTKRLMQGLEGREPIALVVDDTSSVWGNHKDNLVAVERYIYFPASRRQFGSKSRSLLEMRRDETPQSGMLMTALNVLLRTHARMFRVLGEAGGVEAAGYRGLERPLWDVRQVLQDERRQVLAGIHIMFSRVIPLQDGHPELHPMWKKAVNFGATCTTQPSDAVTHVAAYVNGTEKVYWAQRTGKYVVTPEWLNCSAMLWKRAAEEAFPVTATA